MKIPLAKKRTDFSIKSGVFDYKFIREHSMPNPFGIEPGEGMKPLQTCGSKECSWSYDPNTKTTRGKCIGWCATD